MLLAAITLVFIVSLYFIFIRPQEEVQLAASASGEESVLPTPPPATEKKLSHQLYKHLASVTSQLEELQHGIDNVKKEEEEKNTVLQLRMEELNQLLNSKELDITQKDKALNEAYSKIAQAKEDNAKKSEQTGLLVAEISQRDSLIEKGNAEIMNKQKKLEWLNSELDLANQKMSDVTGKQDEVMAGLQSNIEDYKNQVEEYKKRLSEKNASLNEINQKLQKTNEMFSRFESKKKLFSPRFSKMVKELRKKLREKSEKAKELDKFIKENKQIRTNLTELNLNSEEALQKRDLMITDLRKKMDSLKNVYANQLTLAKREINYLNRELEQHDRKIAVPFEEAHKLKQARSGDDKQLSIEYKDLKDKSDWLVKLIREETEKNKKLQEEIKKLRENSLSGFENSEKSNITR